MTRSRSLQVGLLAFALALCLSAGWPGRVEASTWTVTVQATLELVRYQAQFQVDLADPAGSTPVNVLGLPGVVAHTAATFSVSFNSTPAGQTSCVDTVITLTGTGSSRPSGGGFTASGQLNGARVTGNCSGQGLAFVITGVFFAQSAGAASLPPATVEIVSGSALLKTPLASQPLLGGAAVSPGSLIQTAAGGSVTVAFVDGTRLLIGDSTQVTLLPPALPSGDDIVLSQIRGLLTHKVAGASVFQPDHYRLRTSVATVRPTGTEFSTRYSEAGGLGDLLIGVQSGVVEVTGRRGQLTTLVPPMQATFEDSVPRLTLILPVDGGTLVGGRVNTLSWTAFPGAASYVFEYTLSAGGFAQPNPPGVESSRNTVLVAPGLFTTGSGTVEFPLPVPAGVAPAGARAQWRVFPANAAGQILLDTTASDAGTVILQ